MRLAAKTPLEIHSAQRVMGGLSAFTDEAVVEASLRSEVSSPAAVDALASSHSEHRDAQRDATMKISSQDDPLDRAYQVLFGCHAPKDIRAYWTWRLGGRMHYDAAFQGLKEGGSLLPHVRRVTRTEKVDLGPRNWRSLGPLDVLAAAYRANVGMNPSLFFAMACLKHCLGQHPSVYEIVRAVDSYCSALAVRQSSHRRPRRGSLLGILPAWMSMRRRFGDAEIWSDIEKLRDRIDINEIKDSMQTLSRVVNVTSRALPK
jgi:hypothetical protein